MKHHWNMICSLECMAGVHFNTATKPLIVDGAGPDAADNWVENHIEKADMCITSDITLADCALNKKCRYWAYAAMNSLTTW